MSEQIRKIIAEQFLEIAEAMETGSFGRKPLIGIAVSGTELGMENINEGIRLAEKAGIRVCLIQGEDSHEKMESMLESGEIQGAVTMHYPFPIGVSTVGRVITPAMGKELFIADTTGTSDTDRVCGMIKNTIHGIIAAKASGIEDPTVGIANIDGARQTEIALRKLIQGGYRINLTESLRADGGAVMRGNDLLAGTPDIMVMDALTGNLMVKIFSGYTTGGNYEALGYGYGPGIGENFDKVIMIVSRSSGAPVIANAAKYASQIIESGIMNIAATEFKAAGKAGLDDILKDVRSSDRRKDDETPAKCPPKEPVPYGILGVEVMDLDSAREVLWAKGIYAETGMGCTGPVILVSDANGEKAELLLKEAGFRA